MDKEAEIIRKYLKNPQEADELWDSEAIIGIDNEEKQEDVIEYFNTKLNHQIKIEYFENDKTLIKNILMEKDGKLMRFSAQEGEKDIVITHLNDFIKQDYEIRWFMETLCCDALGFVLLERKEWHALENEFGEDYLNHYFEPISLKKKMFALKREESLIYRDLKTSNKSVSYEVLEKLSYLIVEKNRNRKKLKNGEISLKRYFLKDKKEKQEMKSLIRKYKIRQDNAELIKIIKYKTL